VPGVSSYLDRLLEATTVRVAAAKKARSLHDLEEIIKDVEPPRSFIDGLKQPGLSIIAEIKRASPSLGDIDVGLDVTELASSYQAGGARAISVLTEPRFFKGSFEDLASAKAATNLPVLRKDFIIDPYQVFESRAEGADAVLLIVAAIDSKALLAELHSSAIAYRLGVLVEVHSHEELDIALSLSPRVVGVNQRDLTTFDVDKGLAIAMRPSVPDDVLLVAESGVKDRQDILGLEDAGVDAVLIGETLVRATDPAKELKKLLGS
jgi:indole-3-glycerol phosphate synthase